MNFYKIIPTEDKISILSLTAETEKLKKEYIQLRKDFKEYYDAEKKISEMAKRGEKVHFSVKLKRRGLYEKLNVDYNLINRKVEDWNNRLIEIAEKNQFSKLGDYLATQDYLESWEARPSKEIAIKVFSEAKKQKIYRLLLLNLQKEDVGYINLYPKKWLSENFAGIYKTVKQNY